MEIETDGGICKSADDVDKLVQVLTTKIAKTKALQCQLNMYKTVFEYKPPNDNKDIFKFSSSGKLLTPDQLADN